MATAMRTMADKRLDFGGGMIGVIREVWTPFSLAQSPRYFMAQLRVTCVGPADVIFLPLPGPLRFLYPLLRIPLWLWRRAKMGGSKLQHTS